LIYTKKLKKVSANGKKFSGKKDCKMETLFVQINTKKFRYGKKISIKNQIK